MKKLSLYYARTGNRIIMAAVPIQCIWFDLIEKQNIRTITLTKKLKFFLHVVISPIETLVYLQCLKPSYVT